MYERSAIVLERYFDTLLGYDTEGNIQDNFYNYCNLVEKLDKYQLNYQKELVATQEYNRCLKKVKAIQSAQEKLYQKSVKLEYNRNLLFNNIEGKLEDTRKGIEKIEADVEKNNELMKEKKEELLETLVDFSEKRMELSKCKRYKKMAENDYDEILEQSQVNFEAITEEDIVIAREFANFDNAEEIITNLENNGKNEKIPFNEGVMTNATNFSIDISKKLVVSYLAIYEKMKKLLIDIESGVARIDLHKKYVRNEKAKVDFIIAAKEYIFQFLDYERMTVIHGRKSHNRLMNEACENFSADIVQIDNLYELLLKEIVNKATKKAYRELYNKSYLIDIQDKEERFKKEKNRVNLNTATLINSNYWRIEGIKSIYTIFYKNVSEVFGRDVAEFDLPKETDEDSLEECENQNTEVIVKVKEPTKAKIPFEINFNFNEQEEQIFTENSYDYNEEKNYSNEYEENDYNEEYEEDIEDDYNEEYEHNEENEEYEKKSNNIEVSEIETSNIFEEDNNLKIEISEDEEIEEFDIFGTQEDTFETKEENIDIFEDNESDIYSNKKLDEFDIFGEKYKEVDFSEITNSIVKENEKEEIIKSNKIIFDEDIPYELEEAEEELFKTNKNKKKNSIEDFDLTREKKEGTTLIKKLRKIKNIKKTNVESDIW